jgi:dihydrofolate reductase
VTKQGGTTYTFITEGIDAAMTQARAAAADRNVAVAGGATVVQQCLRVGLLDELQMHVAPLLLGDGVRLFENLGAVRAKLDVTRVIESPAVTHIRYRVVK